MRKLFSKKVVLIGSSILLVVAFYYRAVWFPSGVAERYSSYIIYPLLVVQQRIVAPFKSYFEHKKTVSQLEEKILAIQQERDNLLAQNIELNGIISFAQDTQEMVEFRQRYDFSYATLSQVLVKNFSDQSHFFLVDKGARAGVEKDMVVIYKDCLIGRVIEAYPFYSKVALITDQSCKVAAYCAQSKATGIYEGHNEEWAASLKHVSHLSPLEIGELLLSSGDGLIFPRGFGLGKITSYETQGLFHEVKVEPLVNLHTINQCYIVQKGAVTEKNQECSHT